jgi:hypothetical protein
MACITQSNRVRYRLRKFQFEAVAGQNRLVTAIASEITPKNRASLSDKIWKGYHLHGLGQAVIDRFAPHFRDQPFRKFAPSVTMMTRGYEGGYTN